MCDGQQLHFLTFCVWGTSSEWERRGVTVGPQQSASIRRIHTHARTRWSSQDKPPEDSSMQPFIDTYRNHWIGRADNLQLENDFLPGKKRFSNMQSRFRSAMLAFLCRSQRARTEDKSHRFCLLDNPHKDAAAARDPKNPHGQIHTHTHTLSREILYTKKCKYALTVSPWMPKYRWLFYFIFLARSHPSASTWYKPVGFLNAHAFPASVKKMFLRLVSHQQEHSVRNLLQQLAEA